MQTHFKVRCSEEELARWKADAASKSMKFSEYVRWRLNGRVDLVFSDGPGFPPAVQGLSDQSKPEETDNVALVKELLKERTPKKSSKLCPRCSRVGVPSCEECKKREN